MDKDAKLFDEALKLPPEARAALAAKLIDSLDSELDEDAEERWGEEIERRLAEVDAGRVATMGRADTSEGAPRYWSSRGSGEGWHSECRQVVDGVESLLEDLPDRRVDVLFVVDCLKL